MAGGWRVSDDEERAELRRARRAPRATQRTEEAWNHLAAVVERCDRLGLLEVEADEDAATA